MALSQSNYNQQGTYIQGLIVNNPTVNTCCWYFNSKIGCNFGNQCRYQHIQYRNQQQSNTNDTSTILQQQLHQTNESLQHIITLITMLITEKIPNAIIPSLTTNKKPTTIQKISTISPVSCAPDIVTAVKSGITTVGAAVDIGGSLTRNKPQNLSSAKSQQQKPHNLSYAEWQQQQQNLPYAKSQQQKNKNKNNNNKPTKHNTQNTTPHKTGKNVKKKKKKKIKKNAYMKHFAAAISVPAQKNEQQQIQQNNKIKQLPHAKQIADIEKLYQRDRNDELIDDEYAKLIQAQYGQQHHMSMPWDEQEEEITSDE